MSRKSLLNNQRPKRLAGLALVGLASIFFVIFTGSLNAAERDGAPIGIGSMTDTFIIVMLDLVFLGLAFGGIKLAGLSRRSVGFFALAVGAAIALIGAWNHIDGPPLDMVGPESDDRVPIPAVANITVYVVAGLCLVAGLLMMIFGKSKRVS